MGCYGAGPAGGFVCCKSTPPARKNPTLRRFMKALTRNYTYERHRKHFTSVRSTISIFDGDTAALGRNPCGSN